MPESLPRIEHSSGAIRELDLLTYLADTNLSVFAKQPILEYVAATGTDGFMASMKNCLMHPENKLWAIRKGIHGSGIRMAHFRHLMGATNGLGNTIANGAQISVGGKKRVCRLPARLPLTESFLGLLGIYIAEGNGQENYVTIANREPMIRTQIESALRELGVPFFVRQCSDYQVSSTALARLLSRLCGHSARDKRLPDFWATLDDRSLGCLLRSYFDGDAIVSRYGQVIATTASDHLASDLVYALKRFGIHARIRRSRKRATNSNHAGGIYLDVTVSGQTDLARYARAVGFSHPEKRLRLQSMLSKSRDTNVDVVPIAPLAWRQLREGAGCEALPPKRDALAR
jgi:hypothetical protein